MQFKETSIDGLTVCEPKIWGDERGYFFESYNQNTFQAGGIKATFVQDNQSYSSKGVLRGLHFQTGSYAQAKLVRVIKGKVQDVCVDLRKNSPTFGHHISVELSDRNFRQLFIPKGFAHGFLVLENDTIFSYKCDNYYSFEHERGIAFNDPELNINWLLAENNLILSEKDEKQPLLKEASDLFDFNTNLYE